jgi:hypothetical protein
MFFRCQGRGHGICAALSIGTLGNGSRRDDDIRGQSIHVYRSRLPYDQKDSANSRKQCRFWASIATGCPDTIPKIAIFAVSKSIDENAIAS